MKGLSFFPCGECVCVCSQLFNRVRYCSSRVGTGFFGTGTQAAGWAAAPRIALQGGLRRGQPRLGCRVGTGLALFSRCTRVGTHARAGCGVGEQIDRLFRRGYRGVCCCSGTMDARQLSK
jgi:hypothetical protein